MEEEIKYSNSIFHVNNHQFHVLWRFHGIENEIEADVGNFPSPSWFSLPRTCHGLLRNVFRNNPRSGEALRDIPNDYSMTHLRLFVPVQRNKVVSGWWLHIQRGIACYGNLKEWKDFQECIIDFSLFQQCFINFYINSGLKVWWPLNFLLQVQSQKLDSF